MALPIELKVALGGFLTFLFTAGLKALANLFNKDFSGWQAGVVAALVAAVVVFLESLVALIPAEYVEVVGALFALAVTILSAFGFHYTRKNP